MAPSISSSVRIEYAISGGAMRDYLTRENATRALALASYMADLSGNDKAKKAAQVATDVNKITGGKYSTKKFAKDFRNVQRLVGTKQQRRRVGDAIADRAVSSIAGSGLALAGRGHCNTKLQKAMAC